jgi:hypothetical protein
MTRRNPSNTFIPKQDPWVVRANKARTMIVDAGLAVEMLAIVRVAALQAQDDHVLYLKLVRREIDKRIDAREMKAEGHTPEEIAHYLKRTYGEG